jgi:hypothetical protein
MSKPENLVLYSAMFAVFSSLEVAACIINLKYFPNQPLQLSMAATALAAAGCACFLAYKSRLAGQVLAELPA